MANYFKFHIVKFSHNETPIFLKKLTKELIENKYTDWDKSGHYDHKLYKEVFDESSPFILYSFSNTLIPYCEITKICLDYINNTFPNYGGKDITEILDDENSYMHWEDRPSKKSKINFSFDVMKYEVGHSMVEHIDMYGQCRILLLPPKIGGFYYEGGELIVDRKHTIVADDTEWTLIFLPIRIKHEVKTVTKGCRYVFKSNLKIKNEKFLDLILENDFKHLYNYQDDETIPNELYKNKMIEKVENENKEMCKKSKEINDELEDLESKVFEMNQKIQKLKNEKYLCDNFKTIISYYTESCPNKCLYNFIDKLDIKPNSNKVFFVVLNDYFSNFEEINNIDEKILDVIVYVLRIKKNIYSKQIKFGFFNVHLNSYHYESRMGDKEEDSEEIESNKGGNFCEMTDDFDTENNDGYPFISKLEKVGDVYLNNYGGQVGKHVSNQCRYNDEYYNHFNVYDVSIVIVKIES